METLRQDLSYAVRGLRRSPAFTLVALLTLALGIGVNSSIFSVVNAILFQPLPVERPEELAQAVADALVVEPPDEQCEAGPPTAVVASVTPGEPAFAVVDLRVGCDDSVAGARYDLAMEGDDSLGWVISSATRQDICRRGTGGEDLCP